MNFEFMTIDTPLPPCMPFPRALTGFPVSSTAKVMYCRMLDAMLFRGQADENGILFVCFPITAIAAVLSRSLMTVKRSLNELETAGLIMRVRQGVGEPNRIYVLIPGKEDRIPFSSSCPLDSIASSIRQYMTFAVLLTGNPVNALGNGIQGGNGVSIVINSKFIRCVPPFSLLVWINNGGSQPQPPGSSACTHAGISGIIRCK